ncbi:hypothetical protein [Sinorhizobium meliloti]|uniref:hypothetical protein n=1 Tax=Rhizobium meliloti TaxID=382 RepID=UPI000FD7415A|nr:hypothetical protein [Sinorhizobium meliloti]RVL01924.1 hypothetical protein CN152_10855 [Sinorhizobium meliloti]RVN42835.1 hypothetical protein CN113_22930 [Sinorhizobium meliloti]
MNEEKREFAEMSSVFDGLPAAATEMYAAIGLLTVHWASAEYFLDHLILAIHKDFGGSKIQQDPPLSYNKKPKYLRRSFEGHERLRPHIGELNELLDEANQIVEFRKWCAHGVTGLYPEVNGKFTITTLMRSPDYRSVTRKFAPKKIEEMSERAMALAVNIFLFGALQLEIFPKDEANKAIDSLISRKRAAPEEGELPADE